MLNFEGLKATEIGTLQERYGKNRFSSGHKGGFWRIVKDIALEPMFLMLLAACVLYFILKEPGEGLLMFSAMVIVTAISFYQEVKSSRALAALRKYTEPKVMVIRDGKERVIFSEDLLPGDVMVLEEGNRIAADATILQANDLTVNESILTGESLPIDKSNIPGQNQLFQGTTINSGKCYALVTAIGAGTMLGKLGKSISNINLSKTLLQQQISIFVKKMALFGIAAFVLIWVINFLQTFEMASSILLGLTIAMSAVPEEIPVAFSSFMALGAYHMSKLGIITRQPLTIENLGAVSVICLDKTGTITENKMQVREIFDFPGRRLILLNGDEAIQDSAVLRYARLASEAEPFDSMEKAIVRAFQDRVDEGAKEEWQMLYEYPLNGHPPMMSHAHRLGQNVIVAGKGAPERILRICRLNEITCDEINQIILSMASKGYRVLAICSAVHSGTTFPPNQDDFDWQFEGLLSLYDPPRRNVDVVFEKWYKAGIQIKLLTGDYAETAVNIARQVGLHFNPVFFSGDEIMEMEEGDLRRRVKDVHIFARVFPEAKLKVVDALKANGEIVAMTGDGVNDGPALKSSHIGIAMGSQGTEIAKEAADLILTDDNLDKITHAIQQGRKIYSNLKKAIRYIISIHIPIILIASLPLVLGWKYANIFAPIHIIFLELIMGPTCSIFFEKEPVEANIMQQPPRSRTIGMFSWFELWISFAQGLVMTAGLLLLFYFLMNDEYSIEYVRSVVFTTLIINNSLLTFFNRSLEDTIIKTINYRNSLIPYIVLVTVVFILLLYFVHPVQNMFRMTDISYNHFFLCIGVSLLSTGWIEVYKWIRLQLKTAH